MFGYHDCEYCGELYNEYDDSGSCRCGRGRYYRDYFLKDRIINDLEQENRKLKKELKVKEKRIETLIEQLKRSRPRD